MEFTSFWKYLIFLACLATFISCKKQQAANSRTELLTLAPWKLTAVTFHGDWDSDGIIDPIDKDLLPPSGDCSLDNLLIFNVDGSGIYDEGPDKCSGANQSHTFSWSFYNPANGVTDENVIKFQNLGFVALSIIELSHTTLKVKNIVSSGDQIFTYSH